MELTKEEMLKRLRSVDKEKELYNELYKQMEQINFINQCYADEVTDKIVDGPGFLATAAGIAVGFVSWIVYICAFTEITGDARPFLSIVLAVVTGILIRHLIHHRSVVRSEKKMNRDDGTAQDVQAKADAVVEQMHEKIGFLDKDYCYPGAIDELEKIFRTGRADTLKEGMQELEESIHRAKMEELQRNRL